MPVGCILMRTGISYASCLDFAHEGVFLDIALAEKRDPDDALAPL
jgi:hypothetical protein